MELTAIKEALSVAMEILAALKANDLPNGLPELIVLGIMWVLIRRVRKQVAEGGSSCRVDDTKKPPLSAQQDMVINAALSNLVFTYGATRAWVLQPHNGEYNTVTQMSFRKISMTHEITAPGVSHQSKNWQGIPIGIFAWWYSKLTDKRELFIPDVEKFNDEGVGGYQILHDCRIKSIYIVALFGLNHREPIAFVGMHYCKEKRSLSRQDKDSYRATALKICGCLLMDGPNCESDQLETA